jgi:hypothetical protein
MDKMGLYCYVDECGQDTMGRIFVVAMIVVGKERDALLGLCEKLEQESGKGKFKWGKAGYKGRLEYLRLIFGSNQFKGKIRYSVFKGIKQYDLVTIVGIAKAVDWGKPSQDYTVAVYVDGLSKTKRYEYSQELRKLGISTCNVQGVRKDENNSLVRLADAVAGFVRDILDEEQGEAKKLFDQAVRSKALIEV